MMSQTDLRITVIDVNDVTPKFRAITIAPVKEVCLKNNFGFLKREKKKSGFEVFSISILMRLDRMFRSCFLALISRLYINQRYINLLGKSICGWSVDLTIYE